MSLSSRIRALRPPGRRPPSTAGRKPVHLGRHDSLSSPSGDSACGRVQRARCGHIDRRVVPANVRPRGDVSQKDHLRNGSAPHPSGGCLSTRLGQFGRRFPGSPNRAEKRSRRAIRHRRTGVLRLFGRSQWPEMGGLAGGLTVLGVHAKLRDVEPDDMPIRPENTYR